MYDLTSFCNHSMPLAYLSNHVLPCLAVMN